MSQRMRPCTRCWAQSTKKSDQDLAADCGMCWDVSGLDPHLGGNVPPQYGALMARKSGAAVPLWCAAGIGARANPERIVILLSSNPISISGHSINRIKIWLKFLIQPARPWGVSPGCADPAVTALPSATLLASPQDFHHCKVLGWPELQTGQPNRFSITMER